MEDAPAPLGPRATFLLAKRNGSCCIGVMNQFFVRSAVVFVVLSAAIVRAHPGHDGHEGGDFTWDFSHLAAHPLASAACLLIVGAALWAGVSHLRSRRVSAQSLRKSVAK